MISCGTSATSEADGNSARRVALDRDTNAATKLLIMKGTSRLKPPDVQEAVAVMQAARARGRGRRSRSICGSPTTMRRLRQRSSVTPRPGRAWPHIWASEDCAMPMVSRLQPGRPGTLGIASGGIERKRANQKPTRPAAASPAPARAALSGVAAPAPPETPPQPVTANVEDILGRLGGTRARGNRLPRSVE